MRKQRRMIQPQAAVLSKLQYGISRTDDTMKSIKEEVYADFETANPNIKVKHELMPQGTNDREVFVTAMAGGNGPDAYHAAHFPIIADWVGQGLALDLSPYWDSYADKDKFIPSSMEAGTIDGKVYGIPHDMYVTGLFWNKRCSKKPDLIVIRLRRTGISWLNSARS